MFWVACESAVLMPLNIIVLLTGFSWRSEHACQEEPDKSIIPHIHTLPFTFCPVPIWMTACLYNKQHARWLILKTQRAKCTVFIRFSWSRICYALRSFLNIPSWLLPFVCPSLSFSFLQPQNSLWWFTRKLKWEQNQRIKNWSLTFCTLFFNDWMSTNRRKRDVQMSWKCCFKSNIFSRDSGSDWILLTIQIPYQFF